MSGEPLVDRPAVRILCLDPADRVLLLEWADPVDGHQIFEPPGGGVEEGESEKEAARRELREETGFRVDDLEGPVERVKRNALWAGRRLIATEPFFLARIEDVSVAPQALTDEEEGTFRGYRWCGRNELAELGEALEPPELPAILARVVGAGWLGTGAG